MSYALAPVETWLALMRACGLISGPVTMLTNAQEMRIESGSHPGVQLLTQ